MVGQRRRLTENERAYLLRLVRQDTVQQQEMIGKPILKLIGKLLPGDEPELQAQAKETEGQ